MHVTANQKFLFVMTRHELALSLVTHFEPGLWRRNSKLRLRFGCQAKSLTCEIAYFTPSAHAQSDIPGHAFRKRWLFTEISNMLRTDNYGLGFSVQVRVRKTKKSNNFQWLVTPKLLIVVDYLTSNQNFLFTQQISQK